MTNNYNYYIIIIIQPSCNLLLPTEDDPTQCIPSQGMGSRAPQQKLALKTRLDSHRSWKQVPRYYVPATLNSCLLKSLCVCILPSPKRSLPNSKRFNIFRKTPDYFLNSVLPMLSSEKGSDRFLLDTLHIRKHATKLFCIQFLKLII